MRKTALTVTAFLLLCAVAFAQAKTDVNVRVSRNNDAERLVFESDETFLKKTTVSSSGSQITVEFPSAFNIASRKGFDMETSIKDRILAINLKEPFEMKVMRLSSPPRLVIDILPQSAKTTATAAPQQADASLSPRVFVIDAGHGGYDFGIINNDLKEKDITLSIAKDIEAALAKKGKKVFLTRRSDQSMLLKDRAVFANQKSPEMFLSVHVSASENFAVYTSKFADAGSEPGASDLYSLNSRQRKFIGKSSALAENMAKALKEEFNLGIIRRDMSLPVLNAVAAAAVLIEVPSFKFMAYDQNTRSRLANAIIKGFSEHGQ